MTWEQMQEHLRNQFSSTPTLEILIFEIAIVIVAILAFRFINARTLRTFQHFALIAIGVFILEFFTAPMWQNNNLGFWAYVYSDVTWIFTIAWTTMILSTVYFVDSRRPSAPRVQRFALYLVVLTPLALVFDALNKALGIRVYSPEVLAAAGPMTIPILGVPAAGIYYVPVFMALILSFYRHWLPVVEPAEEPGERVSFVRRLLITVVAVFMFEIIVEPMATNQNFPEWSYVFHDITIVMTGFWVILVTLTTFVVDRLLPTVDFRLRFAAYLGLIALIATPIEGWFINNAYRVYGPSATADFIGIKTLIGDLPVEVVAAIPLYLALVISFVRYWDGSVAQGRRLQPRPSEAKRTTSMDVSTPITE